MKKLKEKDMHDSMRGFFGGYLYNAMIDDKDIVLVVGDLGYGLWDKVKADFPTRFYNIGASEQAGADICVGLALAGKKPFFYSITTFLLYRPFETLRTYINHEKIPVRLVASGRDQDYEHDGISHWSIDARRVLSTIPEIQQYWPKTKDEIQDIVNKMVSVNEPSFISLRR